MSKITIEKLEETITDQQRKLFELTLRIEALERRVRQLQYNVEPDLRYMK